MSDTQSSPRRYPRSPKVIIEVTREIIEESKTRSSSHCMIAEAVKASVPGAQSVAVDLQTIRWTDSARGLRYIYLTPRIGQVSLIDFDQGVTPEPFEMKLAKAAQIVAMRGEQKRKQDKRAEWRTVRHVLTVAQSKSAKAAEGIAQDLGISIDDFRGAISKRNSLPHGGIMASCKEWVGKHPEAVEAAASVPNRVKDNAGIVDTPPASGRPNLRYSVANGGLNTTPEVIGGRSPPAGNLAKRREFGLRHFTR